MEQFVLNVQTLSGQGNFHELSDYLLKSMEMLDRNSGQLPNVLETLDIQQHSLGVLAVSRQQCLGVPFLVLAGIVLILINNITT